MGEEKKDDETITIESLEGILNQFTDLQEVWPDRAIIKNLSGEKHVLKATDVNDLVSRTWRLLISFRGDANDYYKAAIAEFNMAVYSVQQQAIIHYERVVDYLGKLPKSHHSRDFYYIASQAFSFLADNQDEFKDMGYLDKAFEYAHELKNQFPNLEVREKDVIGRVFTLYADVTSTLSLENRCAVFDEGIRLIAASVRDGNYSPSFLGQAQAAYSTCCTDPEKRRDLRKAALKNLSIAYDLNPDPGILELIDQVRSESF
jgi:tetratricopeptide (TPR) repeat protein